MVQENLGPHYNKISIFGYVFLCLNFLLFDYLLVVDRDLYSMLTREDSYVEYTGCFLLFLTGGLLFLTGSLRPNKKKEAIVPQWLYLIFACAFIWAVGEEISWGQRLFGFETPEFLRTVNTQNEFNIHNIEKSFLIVFMIAQRLFCILQPASPSFSINAFFSVFHCHQFF